jgi:hypothetical protein
VSLNCCNHQSHDVAAIGREIAARGAHPAFLNLFKLLKSFMKPSFGRLQKFNRADRTP